MDLNNPKWINKVKSKLILCKYCRSKATIFVMDKLPSVLLPGLDVDVFLHTVV